VTGHWTFGQKLTAGFGLVMALAVAIGLVALVSLRRVVATKDRIIAVDTELLVQAERLQGLAGRKEGAARGFLLTRDDRLLDQMQEARGAFLAALERLRAGAPGAEAAVLVAAIAQAESEHQRALEQVVELRRREGALEAVERAFEERVIGRHDGLDRHIQAFVAQQQDHHRQAQAHSARTASLAVAVTVTMVVAAVLVALLLAGLLARALGRRIVRAIGQVQSSSTQLQSAANQQATGSREQATAMTQVATTISELLATSRQIAESAQRVAEIADQTASSARGGDGTLGKAGDIIVGMRRQMDLVVGHMLELGKKSQQIGGVLDIVSELAEQTNILAINATIEAVGAGESGRRFAVVADEIRKLADRVTGSTKEIRGLIDDVRSAVNTTVMATESGSKTVDAGSRQFGEVAAAFKQIAGLVITTTQAAREIELSTKQQATAVEQVNLAIANVAQATRENETSSGQTLQTASQLASLSGDLLRLVRSPGGAPSQDGRNDG
jgi:methyl-accepting chemotaxis protein